MFRAARRGKPVTAGLFLAFCLHRFRLPRPDHTIQATSPFADTAGCPHPPFCADTPARAAVGSRHAAAWPVGQDGQVLLAPPPCCPQAAFLRSVVACHGHKSFPSSDRNFLELTRAYSGECFLNHFCLQLNFGPCGGKEDENCQPSSGNVLLTSHVLIRSYQYFEPFLFCSFDQVAVVKVRPALFRGGTHQVLNEVSPQWHGRALIEQHLHDGFGVFNAFASC